MGYLNGEGVSKLSPSEPPHYTATVAMPPTDPLLEQRQAVPADMMFRFRVLQPVFGQVITGESSGIQVGDAGYEERGAILSKGH